MRPSWDEYFMEIAEVVKTRSTCYADRLVRLLSKIGRSYQRIQWCTHGLKHCDETGCLRQQLAVPSGET